MERRRSEDARAAWTRRERELTTELRRLSVSAKGVAAELEGAQSQLQVRTLAPRGGACLLRMPPPHTSSTCPSACPLGVVPSGPRHKKMCSSCVPPHARTHRVCTAHLEGHQGRSPHNLPQPPPFLQLYLSLSVSLSLSLSVTGAEADAGGDRRAARVARGEAARRVGGCRARARRAGVPHPAPIAVSLPAISPGCVLPSLLSSATSTSPFTSANPATPATSATSAHAT